jgi:hypothetical protein
MTYDKPITEWTEGMLEGRLAELAFGLADGEYSGDSLASATKERDAVRDELMRRRVGDLDDDEEDDAYEVWLEQEERSFMGLDEF